jgi:pyruvate ferredoxin oxidoreductase alpha subunit
VDAFLPPYAYPFPLHPDKPVTMGAFAPPGIYSEARKAQEEALKASKSTICAVWDEFGRRFGRRYTPVETYRAEDAELLLLMMGSFSQTAEVAVDALRQKGKKVGLVRIRLWRPFPFAELRQAVRGAKVLAVFDRCLSYGGSGGPVCGEIKAALYDEKERPAVFGFVGGLGGRDVFPEEFEQIIERGFTLATQGRESTYEMIGVRE